MTEGGEGGGQVSYPSAREWSLASYACIEETATIPPSWTSASRSPGSVD